MKVKTFILTFLMMSCSLLFGQQITGNNYNWEEPSNCRNTMMMFAKLTIDGVDNYENYEIGAFCGNELRGKVRLESDGTIFLTIGGEKDETISFKLYDHSQDAELNGVYENVTFAGNGHIGNRTPVEISANFVASSNSINYLVLQDAINAAQNNGVVTLLADCAENVTVVQAAGKAFTIYGAGKNYTGTITVNGKSAAYATAGLTIKNVNFNATNVADACISLGVSGNTNTRYTSNVTVENCTFTGKGQAKVAIKNYTGGCKNLTVTGCKAKYLHSLVQVKGVAGLTIDDVTVENCKNGIGVGTSTNVNISNSTIAATGYGVRADGSGAYDMTMSNNTVAAGLPVVVRKATGAYNLTVESGEFTASNEKGAAVTFTNGDDGTFEAPTGNATATLADGISQFGFEAKIGNVYYTTFEEAYAKATAEQGVTVCANITGEGFKINKDITIDFGGYTYTINKAVGSTGTESQGFQLLKGNTVKLTNGNIAIAEGTNVKWMFNAYANLTLENINVNCTNMAVPAEGEKNYVLVVNNGGGATPAVNYNKVTIEGFEGTPIWLDPTTTLVAGEGLENTIEVEEGYAVVYNNGTYTAIAANVQVKDGETVKGTYATIADAITAANAGNTIVLLKDITENFTINKNVTLDGANFNYTGTMTGNKGITATIKNVNFVNAGFEKPKAQKSTTGEFTFTNCTFDGKGTYAYPINVNGANTVTVEDCTVKDYQYSFLYVPSSTLTVNIKNVTVENCPSYAVYFASGVTNTAIENLTVKNSNNGFIINNTANRALNLKNCTFKNVTTAINHTNGTNTITCNLDGVNEIGDAAFSEYVKIVADAQLGTKIYGDLQDAITAAEATEENETIKVVADFTTEKSYTVKGTVTLDLNGKTIAGTDNATQNFGLININPGADLTINDSSEDKSGAITLTATTNSGWGRYSSVVSNQRGKLTVNGGTIEHLGGTDMAYAIDNLTNTGAQIAETVIYGGNIKSTYLAIRQFANSATGENILTINGGNISSTWMQSPNANANLAATTVEGGNVEQIRISGDNAILDLKVKASCLGEAGVWGTMPTGKVLKEVEGYYTLVDAIAKIVAADNTTTYYASIQDAINAAAENQVVTVCADVELENTITVAAGKVVTLDLNGKVVSGVSSAATTSAVITNKGNLTVMSSVEGGKVTSQALTPDTEWGGEGQPSFPSYANNTVRNEGTLTLVSGTIENTSEAGGATYAIDNYAGSTTNINGGVVYCENNFAIRLFSNGDINMNVTGGTITGTRAIWMQLPSGANSTAKPDVNLNITGGTLTSIDEEYNLAVYVYSYGQSAENVNLSISGENTVINGNVAVYEPTVTMKENSVQVSGGTFNGEYGVYSYADTEDAAPVISITGGTFATNYSEQYAEDDNFIFVQNAEGTYTVTEGAYVAQIGETRYSSLAAAVTAATSGQTVTLLRDVNESVTITGKTLTLDGGNYNYTGMFTTTGSSSNYTYTFRNFNIDGGDGIYFVKSNGSNVNFVIENCTVKNKDYGFFYGNKSFNKLTVNKVTIDNCPYVARITSGGNSLTFNEVKVTNSTNGIYIKNTTKRNFEFTNCDIDTKITVDGGTSMTTFKFDGENTVATLSASQYAKYVLAAADATLTAPEGYDVTTTVEGCTVKYVDGAYKVIPAVAAIGDVVYGSIQEAINAAQDDDVIVVLKDIEVNIDNVEGLPIVDGYPTYYEVTGKTISIDLNGKTIKANVTTTTMLLGLFSTEENGNLTFNDSSNGNGTIEVVASDDANVYALITNYESTSAITINGGNYKLNKTGKNGQSLIYDSPGNMVINGGNFYLGNIGTSGVNNGLPWIFNTYQSNANSVTVNGGTFNADINHQYWAHEVNVPETLALKDNGNGTWTVVPAEAYVKEYFASSNYKYSRNVGYATLEEALAVAMEKDFTDVVLVADITTEASYSIAAGETVVLDLNGKTITGTDNTTKNFGLIQNNGTLTVNATNGGMMTVVATTNSGWNRYSAVISNNPGATLTVNGGTIEHLGGTDMAYGIDALTNGGIGDVNTTINGGTIKSTYRAVRQFLNSDSKENNLTVNGGTLEGTNKSIFFHDPSKKANNGKVTVSTDAKLVGDVYLYVTEGSTEWPVEVSIAKDAFTSGTVLSANVPASYSVETVDGFWTVLDVQSQELSQGWNWYSTYLNYDLAKLQTALGTDGKQIEAQTSYCKYQSGNWFGSMQSVSVKEMYKIEVAADVTLNISGELADFNESIDIKTGFNWIGYPFNKAVAIDEALSSFTPAAGDYVMAQKSFAVYYQDRWQGTLKQMTPGQGYIYERVGENTTLNYTVESVRGIAEDNITADNNYWVPDARMYPNNMAVIAVLEGAMNENYEVAAFVNGEVRGSARPIYIDALDSYMFFMTIHGEGVEEMTFKCYDLNTNTEYDLNNVINYSDNAFLGSIDKPYVLTRGTTGVGETLSSNFNIYPNPTTTDSEINLSATFDKVEVFNALGVKVIEYQNVDSIDALETAGIYVIRVTNNGDVKHCRLVVK